MIDAKMLAAGPPPNRRRWPARRFPGNNLAPTPSCCPAARAVNPTAQPAALPSGGTAGSPPSPARSTARRTRLLCLPHHIGRCIRQAAAACASPPLRDSCAAGLACPPPAGPRGETATPAPSPCKGSSPPPCPPPALPCAAAPHAAPAPLSPASRFRAASNTTSTQIGRSSPARNLIGHTLHPHQKRRGTRRRQRRAPPPVRRRQQQSAPGRPQPLSCSTRQR